MIRLDSCDFGTYLIVEVDENGHETGNDLLVQTDWDYPGIATDFGWQACECGFTDGTIDCEHKTTSAMIASAHSWLDDSIGEITEDPGYFS